MVLRSDSNCTAFRRGFWQRGECGGEVCGGDRNWLGNKRVRLYVLCEEGVSAGTLEHWNFDCLIWRGGLDTTTSNSSGK